jgi:hypothetical protein
MPTLHYLDRLAAAIAHAAAAGTPVPPAHWPLYRLYAVLVLAKGTAVTAEDVHNAWVAWASEHQPASPYLVPYGELPGPLQDLDGPYLAAIHAVARQPLPPA